MLKNFPTIRLFASINLAFAVVACVLCSAATTDAADTALRYKFTPGEKLTYECNQNVSTSMALGDKVMKSTIKIILVASQEVKAVDADGVATVVKTIESVKMTMAMPQGVNLEYDSSVKKDRSGMEKMIADQFTGVIGKPIEMKIDAMGNVKDMIMPEGMTAKQGMIGGDNLKHSLGVFSFPQEAVTVGKTWTVDAPMPSSPGMGKGVIHQTYEYMGPDKENAKGNADLEKIQVKTKVEITADKDAPARMKLEKQEGQGEILFDNKAGRLKSSTTKDQMVFNMEMMGQSMKNTVNTVMEIKLVPNSGAK